MNRTAAIINQSFNLTNFVEESSLKLTDFSFPMLEPDGAPQNVNGHNTGSTSILVTWDEVLPDRQNGIITGYTIAYQSQTESHNGNVPAGPNDRQKNITGLKEYVFYNITVFTSTVKGDGPHSSPVLVVRTDQDSE